MELVRYSAFGYKVNHLCHLVAASRHHKPYAVGLAQNTRCGFYKILRTFLHRDTAEECHQFVFALRFLELFGMCQRLYGVVYRAHFARVDAVFLYHRVTRQIAHADDMVRLVHAAFLDGIYCRIDIAAAAVEIGGMHVNHQRLPADMFGEHSCRISQPVMTVNNIKIQTVCQHACYRLVVAYLFYQVVGIAPRESYAP